MYKCSNCGGELRYDIASSMLVCGYCGSKSSMLAYERSCKQAKQDAAWERSEELWVFRCPQCGGELMTNDSSISGYCAYCGASAMLERRGETRKMPARIVPFSVTKDACKETFNEYVQKMPYVPAEYKEQHDKVEFRGIYVPFHRYNVDLEGEKQYKGKTDHIENPKKRKHVVNVYKVTAEVEGSVSGIEHDASQIFSDEASEAIVVGEGTSQPFHPAYLSGFYADMEDVPAEAYDDYAMDYVKSMIDYEIEKRANRNLGGGHHLKEKKSKLHYEISHSDDILRPVWFMARKTKDRVAYAVVNGTGKQISADLPVDTKKLFRNSLITSAVLFILLQLFITLTPKAMVGWAAFFQLILTCVYSTNIEQLYQREIDHTRVRRKGLRTWMKEHIVTTLISLSTLLVFVLLVWLLVGSAAFVVGCLGACELVILGKNMPKWIALVKHGTKPTLWIVAAVLATFALTALLWLQPVHDYWYYAGGTAGFLVTLVTMLRTISDYNLLCSQPLPQFAAYKGGNDDERE